LIPRKYLWIYVYDGIRFQEIDDTVKEATYTHSSIWRKIENIKSLIAKNVEDRMSWWFRRVRVWYFKALSSLMIYA
jgi:hypothetical protein